MADSTETPPEETAAAPEGGAPERPSFPPRGDRGDRGPRRDRGDRGRGGDDGDGQDLIDRLVSLNRVAKVVKGGRRFSFSALVVAGDGNGRVGAGLGKANEVPEAIRKGFDQAKKNLFAVPIAQGGTIPHEVLGHFGSGRVVLRPASEGTGVIAGGAVRAVLESAGIHNILTKCIGSSNPHNVVKATIDALQQLRAVDAAAKRRGLDPAELKS